MCSTSFFGNICLMFTSSTQYTPHSTHTKNGHIQEKWRNINMIYIYFTWFPNLTKSFSPECEFSVIGIGHFSTFVKKKKVFGLQLNYIFPVKCEFSAIGIRHFVASRAIAHHLNCISQLDIDTILQLYTYLKRIRDICLSLM